MTCKKNTHAKKLHSKSADGNHRARKKGRLNEQAAQV